jgi:hypothetical protein
MDEDVDDTGQDDDAGDGTSSTMSDKGKGAG